MKVFRIFHDVLYLYSDFNQKCAFTRSVDLTVSWCFDVFFWQFSNVEEYLVERLRSCAYFVLSIGAYFQTRGPCGLCGASTVYGKNTANKIDMCVFNVLDSKFGISQKVRKHCQLDRASGKPTSPFLNGSRVG